jgi:pimeloyl-ACP methyl ester carboxylesterase
VVFVANGSGDLLTASTSLRQVVTETATPLQVEAFDWSHGYLRFLSDHVDHCNHLDQGRLLAAQVMDYRRCNPHGRINLLGYSTGSAVVLAAADLLPKQSIDRIVLLAPSVCANYDLRPALAATRDGIDVFYSKEDRYILGMGMKIIGTAEGCRRQVAGQCGFQPIIECPADTALYGKLHQHAWDPSMEWTGHTGGHYGSNQPDFVRVFILPLLVR